MKGKLYQTIEKKHMEWMTESKISDEVWEKFVNERQDAFADEVSVLAREFFQEWVI